MVLYILFADYTAINHIEDSQEFLLSDHGMCSDHPHISFMKWTTRCSFPSKINESTDTPFIEMDPDIQFYSSTHYALNTRCDYFIEDTFLTISLE